MPIPNVYVCVGCNLLNMSDRNDCLTCSIACRVRAHRNGTLKELRRDCERMHVPPGMVVRMKAAIMLVPALADRFRAGSYEIDDARDEVWEAFKAHLKAHGLL